MGITGIVFAADPGEGPVSYTWTSPTNATTYDISPVTVWANVTLNASLQEGYCNLTIENTNGTTFSNVTTLNDTNTTYYVNITPYLAASLTNQWHNLTYCCNDTIGSGNVTFSSLEFIKYDITNPTFTFRNWTVQNTSTHRYIDIQFNVNLEGCGIYITHEDATSTFKEGSYLDGALLNGTGNCTLNVTWADITQDGDFTITHWANDTGTNSANGSTTEVGVFTLLKEGWNMVSATGFLDNTTSGGRHTLASDILDNLPNCTYLSLWDNREDWKNYTTFGISTPTVNGGLEIKVGNATWIYCTSNQYYYRRDYLTLSTMGADDMNQSLLVNKTSTVGTRWNLIGLANHKTLNDTLWPGDEHLFTTTAQGGDAGNGNITAVAWFNTTGDNYITCVKALGNISYSPLCNAGYNASEVTIREGSAIWVHTNQNLTLNRTGF